MLGLAEDYERQENSYVSNNNHSSMDYTHWFVMGLGQSDLLLPSSLRAFRRAGIIEPTAGLAETTGDHTMVETPPAGESSKPEIPAITVQRFMLRSRSPNKNPTAHGNGLSSDSASASAITFPAPRPLGFPMWGVAETRKAPSFEGASSIFVIGQKKSAFSNF